MIIDLPESRKNLNKVVTLENLKKNGFLPENGKNYVCSPQSKHKKKVKRRKKKAKPSNVDDEGIYLLGASIMYIPNIIIITNIY